MSFLKNKLITLPSRPRQHDFCLRSAATNKRFLHFCNVAKAVTKNCFVTALKLWVLIWDYCQQDLVKFQTFISFTLYLEKTLKLNLQGKKQTFKTFSSILYKIFSDIQFSKCFFESRARRTKCFFPEFFLVSLHFDVFCAFCCIFVIFTWTPSTRPYSSWSSRQVKR